MSYEVGSRVFAVRENDDTTVYAYGYGVYVGDFPMPGWAPTEEDRARVERVIREVDGDPLDMRPFFDAKVTAGDLTREEADAHLAEGERRHAEQLARPMAERVEEHLQRSSLNPKIVLDDNAGVVWGFECWWGPADSRRWAKYHEGRELVFVSAPHPAEAVTSDGR